MSLRLADYPSFIRRRYFIVSTDALTRKNSLVLNFLGYQRTAVYSPFELISKIEYCRHRLRHCSAHSGYYADYRPLVRCTTKENVRTFSIVRSFAFYKKKWIHFVRRCNFWNTLARMRTIASLKINQYNTWIWWTVEPLRTVVQIKKLRYS